MAGRQPRPKKASVKDSLGLKIAPVEDGHGGRWPQQKTTLAEVGQRSRQKTASLEDGLSGRRIRSAKVYPLQEKHS